MKISTFRAPKVPSMEHLLLQNDRAGKTVLFVKIGTIYLHKKVFREKKNKNVIVLA